MSATGSLRAVRWRLVLTPARSTAAQLFLDLDLAVLAADSAQYAEYAANIRREYAHVPELDFCNGRARVLEHLIAAETVFLTDAALAGGPAREAQAKANVRHEIRQLQDKASRLQ